MLRTLYMAGVNTRPLAVRADACDSWLVSYTLLARAKDWIAPWVRPYLDRRRIIWDPGTFSHRAVTYAEYLAFLDAIGRATGTYLQYDAIGDAEQTARYLEDMRERGYDPVPILQPGGDARILQCPQSAIGGLLRLSPTVRRRYLDGIFYGVYPPSGAVHLLGLTHADWFRRYPARSGDSTTWLPRFAGNREREPEEWARRYGDQHISWEPPHAVQMAWQEGW